MKIEIWAPAPYECIEVRPVKQGDMVLNCYGEAEEWAVPTKGAVFPILRESVRFEVDQVRNGLRGLFADACNQFAPGERELKVRRKITNAEICRDGEDVVVIDRFEYVDEHGKAYDRFKPTRIRTVVEAWVPEGYRPVRYGFPNPGDEFILDDSGLVYSEGFGYKQVLIVEREGRTPTLLDLGKQCRFWPTYSGESVCGQLWGVELYNGTPHFNPTNSTALYENCEVIDEG